MILHSGNLSRWNRLISIGVLSLTLCACSKAPTDVDAAAGANDARASRESGETGSATTLNADVMKAAGVRLETIAMASLQGQIRAPGEVVENAYGTTLITPRVAALVVRRHVRLGDEVAKGAPLVTLSSPEVADAQAGLQLAEQEWERMRALGRDLVSGRRYGEAQVAVEQARAKARAYGLPGTAAGRASGEFTLTAPHAGRVTQDDFVVGQQMEPGQALLRLVDETLVWVDAKLPGEVAQRIAPGTTVQIGVGKENLTGKVMQRGHHTEEQTRTAEVRIEVNNTGDRLHAGDLVEARFELEGPQSSQLVVPTAALTLLQGQTVAFRLDPEGAMEPVPVETGETNGGNTIVRAGLKPGDRVAVAGVYALKSYLLRSQIGEAD